MFLEELEDLKNRCPERLVLHHVLSREPQDSELFHGRIDGPRLTRFLETLVPVGEVDEWFLCGPQAMAEELRQTLIAAGADPATVHRELFHTGPIAPRRTAAGAAEGTATVTVDLDGRATSFELDPRGESILDATLRLRPEAPYACKGGVCGTCRARVTEGSVEMDGGFALEADEIAAGFVLACQSHPASERVRLDFDA
jgi:ring-1,2-phenylacetyl-CoA epoxidase subunit PaaE